MITCVKWSLLPIPKMLTRSFTLADSVAMIILSMTYYSLIQVALPFADLLGLIILCESCSPFPPNPAIL